MNGAMAEPSVRTKRIPNNIRNIIIILIPKIFLSFIKPKNSNIIVNFDMITKCSYRYFPNLFSFSGLFIAQEMYVDFFPYVHTKISMIEF